MSVSEAVTSAEFPQSKSSRRKAIIAGSVGNCLEWFDWGIYGYFAAAIGTQFFPKTSESTQLLLVFLTFALGFFMRPLGAILLGGLGDKVGRRNILSTSIIIMAVGSLIIGLCPTYEQIGIAAPIILVAARLAQGFSAGGEFGAAGAFLVENAAGEERGVSGSYQQAGQVAGTLLASAVAALMTAALSQQLLNEWAWRAPFIVGSGVGILGFYLRRGVQDTVNFEALRAEGGISDNPFRDLFANHFGNLLRVCGMTLCGTIVYYVWLYYLPTYYHLATGMPKATAQAANVVGLILLLLLIIPAGRLSDRIGRKPCLATFAIGMTILAVPLFLSVSNSLSNAIIVQCIGVALFSLQAGSIVSAMAEQFPTRVRMLGMAMSYTVTVAVFGGTAPFVATWLQSMQMSYAMAIYISIAGIISSIVFLTMPETSRTRLQ
jgi:MFS transporter, MHS family, alpha-ketoglutarate permease